MLPDSFDQVGAVTRTSETRAAYLWNFFQRSKAAGNQVFWLQDPKDELFYLVEFIDDALSFEVLCAKVYSTGLQLRQRRLVGIESPAETTLLAPSALVGTAFDEGQIDLEWESNTAGSETGFKIERKTEGQPFIEIGTVATGVLVYSDTTAISPQIYTYRLRAYDVVNDSPYSNESVVLMVMIWLDVTTLSLSNDSALVIWPDRMPFDRDAAAPSGKEPTYKSNVNGYPAVLFDGVDDRLVTTSFSPSLPFTIWMVVKTIGGARLLSGGAGDLNGNVIAHVSDSPELQLYSESFACINDDLAFGVWGVIVATFNEVNSSLRINHLPPVFGDPGAAVTTSGFTIGAPGAGYDGLYGNFYMRELVGAEGAVSVAMRTHILNTLFTKYGIQSPVAFPGQLVFEGDSLTFGARSTDGQSYPTQLLTSLGPTWEGVNFAISGETAAAMAIAAPTRIDPLISSACPANVLCFWAGTNDLYIGGATATDTYNTIRDYCLARQTVGWRVVVLTILPRLGFGTPPAGFEADRQSVNASIRANWATFADALADVGDDATIGQAGDPSNTTYYDDLVHLKNAGYAIVAGIVEGAIATL